MLEHGSRIVGEPEGQRSFPFDSPRNSCRGSGPNIRAAKETNARARVALRRNVMCATLSRQARPRGARGLPPFRRSDLPVERNRVPAKTTRSRQTGESGISRSPPP